MLENPTILGVVSLGESSIVLRVMVKTITERHYGVERSMRQFIKEVLDENKIEIPFPQVVVHKAD
jgi:small conductance mechanosensitive channel